jgi:hypothetical protein
MNLQRAMTKAKQRLHEAQERVARNILIWLEKEPSQDRVLGVSAGAEVYGPYLRYRSRGRRRALENEKPVPNHAGNTV